MILRLAGDHPEPHDPAAKPTLGELEPPPDNAFALYPEQVAAYAAVEDVPSVAAELCTTAGLAGRPGDDRIIAVLARWRGHHGRFVHRAALTGLARVQTVPDRATLTELVRCLILPPPTDPDG